MTIIDLHDPWPDTETLAMEVTPKGPYVTFRRPWSLDEAPAGPRQFGGLLTAGPPSPGLLLTAGVDRMSSARWSLLHPWGPVYLRAFGVNGRQQWTARFTRVKPGDVYTDSRGITVTFNLYAPFTFDLAEMS